MKKVTQIVICIALVGLIIYDVIAIVQGGTEASISSIIITYAYKMPMMPFMVGFLMGHLFWRMRTNKDTKKIDGIK